MRIASTCGARACSVYTHANARANPGHYVSKMDFPTRYISLVTALFFDTVFHRMLSLDNNKIKLQKVLTGVAPYTKVQLQNMDSLVVDMCFWDAMRETETKTVTRGTSMRGKIYRNVFHDLKSLLCLLKTLHGRDCLMAMVALSNFLILHSTQLLLFRSSTSMTLLNYQFLK